MCQNTDIANNTFLIWKLHMYDALYYIVKSLIYVQMYKINVESLFTYWPITYLSVWPTMFLSEMVYHGVIVNME